MSSRALYLEGLPTGSGLGSNNNFVLLRALYFKRQVECPPMTINFKGGMDN